MLNQLLSVPLPIPSPKPKSARSMIFEGSRPRERSTSRGF
nr:VirE3 export signal [Cloning vector pEX302]